MKSGHSTDRNVFFVCKSVFYSVLFYLLKRVSISTTKFQHSYNIITMNVWIFQNWNCLVISLLCDTQNLSEPYGGKVPAKKRDSHVFLCGGKNIFWTLLFIELPLVLQKSASSTPQFPNDTNATTSCTAGNLQWYSSLFRTQSARFCLSKLQR